MPKVGDTVFMNVEIFISGDYKENGWQFTNIPMYLEDNDSKLENFVKYDLERLIDDLCDELEYRYGKE